MTGPRKFQEQSARTASFQNLFCSVFVLVMARRSIPQAKLDKDAWPIVVRVLVPPRGPSQLGRDNDIDKWLLELGRGEATSLPHSTVLGDGLAFNFRRIEDANAFLDCFPGLVLADATMAKTYYSPHVPL